MWKSDRKGLIFKAGEGIKNIVSIRQDSSYELRDTASNDQEEIEYLNLQNGTKLTILIHPEQNYILDSWNRTSNKGYISDPSLLTMEYTVNGDEVLTAIGKQGSYTNIQDLADCMESGTNVTDKRDGESYTVAKLSDGRCWMTQNLRIENKTLTSADSDIIDSFTLPPSRDEGFDSDVAGLGLVPKVFISQKTGGKYNTAAATADSILNTVVNNDANYSICPKGWKLPSKNDYSSMRGFYSQTSIAAIPANFVYGGHYYSSDYRGPSSLDRREGYWWTSTKIGSRCDNREAYCFLNTNNFGSNCSPGMAIRCVKR